MFALQFIPFLLCASSFLHGMESVTLINQTHHDIDHLVVCFNVEGMREGKKEKYDGNVMRDKFPAGHCATFHVEDAINLVHLHPLISHFFKSMENVLNVSLQKIQCDQFLIQDRPILNYPGLAIKWDDAASHFILESTP